ncbi:MAG: hypothetical protein WDN00_19520 [Limisphaerales bacterium]
MFNLEHSIVEWRQQMLAVGIKSPVPLEELELHLREDIERQIKVGLSEQTAFEISARLIGQPKMLKSEFKKGERTFVKTNLKCVVVLLIGIAAQLPGSLQLRDQLVISDKWLGLWLLGLVFQMFSLEAMRQIIQPKLTGRELKKVEWSSPKANLKTGVGVAVLLVGIALIVPAATQSIRDGLVAFDALCGLVFGFCLLIASTLVMCFPYQRRVA